MKVLLLFLISLPFFSFAQPVSETGLPLPRFVSLKSDEANMRNGPGKRYPVKWTYQRKGLPIKIVNEYQQWRKIEDHEGIGGWMHKSVLSGTRNALIRENDVMLRDDPGEGSSASLKLMKNVIVHLEGCRKEWCEISYKNHNGWVPVSLLWGASPTS